LNLLVALDALLGQRSVTAAARLTRVTPSAMSHSLAELRTALGDPLLARSGRAMVLTPRAEALGPPLRKVLLDAKRLLAGGTRPVNAVFYSSQLGRPSPRTDSVRWHVRRARCNWSVSHEVICEDVPCCSCGPVADVRREGELRQQ
jgi:hypothetical protein